MMAKRITFAIRLVPRFGEAGCTTVRTQGADGGVFLKLPKMITWTPGSIFALALDLAIAPWKMWSLEPWLLWWDVMFFAPSKESWWLNGTGRNEKKHDGWMVKGCGSLADYSKRCTWGGGGWKKKGFSRNGWGTVGHQGNWIGWVLMELNLSFSHPFYNWHDGVLFFQRFYSIFWGTVYKRETPIDSCYRQVAGSLLQRLGLPCNNQCNCWQFIASLLGSDRGVQLWFTDWCSCCSFFLRLDVFWTL